MQEFSEGHDNVSEKNMEIKLPAIRLKSLDQVEALINELQQIARLTWAPRRYAMGTASMDIESLLSALGRYGASKTTPSEVRAAITMAGNIEIYKDDELQGFVEVREGGGYVEL